MGWHRALIPDGLRNWLGLPLAGAGIALGQAPWDLWVLALPCWVLALLLLAGTRFPFLAGWVLGGVHFAVALSWLTEPFRVDPGLTGWLAIPALAAAAIGFGLFWAGAARVGRWLSAGGSAAPVVLAACFGLAELLRSYVLTGFPWALPGHVLIGSPALPAAALGGAHGLGWAVLAGAGLLASARPLAMGAGAALWVAPLAAGALLPPAPVPDETAPVIRLVQPNAPQHLKWDPGWIGVFFRRALELTSAAPERGAGSRELDLVLWPETTLPALLENSVEAREAIAGSTAAPVVLGAQRYALDGMPRNSLALLQGDGGRVEAVLDKHHLVPFGEYLPLPRLFSALGAGPLAARLAGTYRPGPGPALLDLPDIGRALPMICYEAIFPQYLWQVERPDLLLHLTNDAWFGTRVGPHQHLALARLRAAESGLPLLRAANTGISAVIDARGEVIAALPLGEAGRLDATLPPAMPPTLYVRTGDWLALGLLVLTLGAAVVTGRMTRAPSMLARSGERA
jgi:apolipoprotein N-acyltransferase